MYRMKADRPCMVCHGEPLSPAGIPSCFCEGGRTPVSNHEYNTRDELATAVANFVLDAIPPSRSPIDTTVAHRVLTWDGNGTLTFPLANMTNVYVTQER